MKKQMVTNTMEWKKLYKVWTGDYGVLIQPIKDFNAGKSITEAIPLWDFISSLLTTARKEERERIKKIVLDDWVIGSHRGVAAYAIAKYTDRIIADIDALKG